MHESNLSDGGSVAEEGGVAGVEGGVADLGHKRNLSDSQVKSALALELASIQVCMLLLLLLLLLLCLSLTKLANISELIGDNLSLLT